MRRRSAALDSGALPPHIVKLQEERMRQNKEREATTSKTSADNEGASTDASDKGTGSITRKTSFLDQAALSTVGETKATSSSSSTTTTTATATAPSTPSVPLVFLTGVHHDQGVRFSMEDAHSISQPLGKLNNALTAKSPAPSATQHECAFFGVYDGHGGTEASLYCKEHLPQMIEDLVVANLANQKTGSGGGAATTKIVVDSIIAAFQTIDVNFLKHCWDNGIGNVGTTVTTVLCYNGTMYCGNAGDSRTVLCRNGKAMNLSHDHKPTDANEESRIRNNGGFVVMGVSTQKNVLDRLCWLCWLF